MTEHLKRPRSLALLFGIAAVAILTLVFMTSDRTALIAGTGSSSGCERHLNHFRSSCNPEGAPCGGNCTCRSVESTGLPVAWKDCYCLAPGVTRYDPCWCKSGGGWRVYKIAGTVAKNSSAKFQFVASSINGLEIFNQVDIDAGGNVTQSQKLVGINDVTGTFDVAFGNDPGTEVAAIITQMDAHIAPLHINGLPSGNNNIREFSGTQSATGVFDLSTGNINFSNPVPVMLHNDLVPSGYEITIRPVLFPVDGTTNAYDVLMSASITYPL